MLRIVIKFMNKATLLKAGDSDEKIFTDFYSTGSSSSR